MISTPVACVKCADAATYIFAAVPTIEHLHHPNNNTVRCYKKPIMYMVFNYTNDLVNTKIGIVTTLLLSFLFLPNSTTAQDVQAPNKVAVTYSGDDTVGNTLVYELREEISSSQQMSLVNTGEEISKVMVRIVTMDPFTDTEMSGNSTVYSITWSFYATHKGNSVDINLTSYVGYSGIDSASSTANDLVAITDKQRRKVPAKLVQMIDFVNSVREEPQ